MRRLVITALVLGLLASAAAGQEDPGQQAPSGPGYDEDGLLEVSPEYFELAAATGGDFYFWAPGEFAAVAPIGMPTESEDILLAYGRLDGDITTFTFPVDSTVARFSLVAGAQQKLTFTLLRPDGVVVNAAQEGVAFDRLEHMVIIGVDRPAVGPWRFEAQGRGLFSLSVRARVGSDDLPEGLTLLDFDFVELRGRPGHEGFFEIRGPVVGGQEHLCRAILSGPWSAAKLGWIVSSGETMADAASFAAALEEQPEELLAPCTPPHQAFRAVLTGKDRTGAEFMRTWAAQFEPRYTGAGSGG